MKLSDPSRFITACIALFGMLFMQLAVASYACPGMPMGSYGSVAVMPASMEQSGMTGCDGMDTVQPGLCHALAHGDAARQSLDKPPSSDVAPFVPAALVLALPVVDAAFGPAVTPPASLLLTRVTAPPIAIRHCCFRI